MTFRRENNDMNPAKYNASERSGKVADDYATAMESGITSVHDGSESYQLRMMDDLNSFSSQGRETAIDVPFPERFVDELSRREVFNKHLFRPNTYLHKWWARRCGTTFRAILKQFVSDAEQRNYYVQGGLEGKTVLDPMMGGGTTLHEAIRLGANVVGADIDPIPIVQARASLTQAPLPVLRASFESFFANLYNGVGHYFQTECPNCQRTVDSNYTLYGLRKTCDCGDVVQIDQYALRHEPDRSVWICPQSREITDVQCEHVAMGRTERLIAKSEKECACCRQSYVERLDLPFYARYTPVAIVASCGEHGTFFRSPGEADFARIEEAAKWRTKLDFEPLEDFAVKDGPKSGDLRKRRIYSYLDLFSSRQLLYLHQAMLQLKEYDDVEKLNLGMLISASLEFNSMLCGYKGWYKRRPGAIRHVFALHAYSFPYTALENNPVNPRKSSGNLQLLFRDRIERGRKWADLPVERKIGPDGKSELVQIAGELDTGVEISNQAELEHGRQKFYLFHGDSQDLPLNDHSIDLVVTDPPYYDNVQYSNLSMFFRVWLTRLLPNEVEWRYDEARSAVATKTSDSGSSFMKMLAGIFAECGRVLKPQTGRMAFTFHHWDPMAWAELTIALKGAGFRLIDASVVYSEHPISVHIRNLKSLKHDSVLVFALDGNAPSASWEPLDTFDTDDSEAFCRQCGLTLGWLLESRFSPVEIRAVWKRLIQGKLNAANAR